MIILSVAVVERWPMVFCMRRNSSFVYRENWMFWGIKLFFRKNFSRTSGGLFPEKCTVEFRSKYPCFFRSFRVYWGGFTRALRSEGILHWSWASNWRIFCLFWWARFHLRPHRCHWLPFPLLEVSLVLFRNCYSTHHIGAFPWWTLCYSTFPTWGPRILLSSILGVVIFYLIVCDYGCVWYWLLQLVLERIVSPFYFHELEVLIF